MRRYTAEELKRYWMARCPECGWKGLSCDCGGFGPLGESGDYDDGYCPNCDSTIGDARDEPIRPLLWFWRAITLWRHRRRWAEERYWRRREKEWRL